MLDEGMGVKRLTTIVTMVCAMAFPGAAVAGHGLELLDHPGFPLQPPGAPLSSTFNSGGPGAEWELVTTIPTGNPHTDVDFFTQGGDTYASVGTLGIGPNAGGQTIVRLTQGGAVDPEFVAGHRLGELPIESRRRRLGLQHDVEATPKGDALLNSDNPFADRSDAQLLVDATDAPGRCHDQGVLGLAGVPQGGLEIVDITDRQTRSRSGSISHIGESHTVNVDPKRPHIAYSVDIGLGRRQRRRDARQNEIGTAGAGPRRLRGRRPVVVHELPGGDDASSRSARRAGPRSTATATRAPRCRAGPHAARRLGDLRLPRARGLPRRPADVRRAATR